MKKTLLILVIFAMLAPALGYAQTIIGQSQGNKNAIVKSHPQVKKWGKATLIVKDEKGKVILNQTEIYPIIDPATIKASSQAPDNCWNWCRKVCDGYGVCWLSCGWHCSPWPKK